MPLGLPSLLLGPQSANWAGKVFLLVPLNRQRVPGSLRQRGFLDWVTYLRQVSISKYVTSFLCLDFEYWCHNTCALIVHVILAHTCSLLSALFSSLSGHYAAGMRQVALLLRWLHVSKWSTTLKPLPGVCEWHYPFGHLVTFHWISGLASRCLLFKWVTSPVLLQNSLCWVGTYWYMWLWERKIRW